MAIKKKSKLIGTIREVHPQSDKLLLLVDVEGKFFVLTVSIPGNEIEIKPGSDVNTTEHFAFVEYEPFHLVQLEKYGPAVEPKAVQERWELFDNRVTA